MVYDASGPGTPDIAESHEAAKRYVMVWLSSFRQSHSYQPLDDQDNVLRYLLEAYFGIAVHHSDGIIYDHALLLSIL